MHYENFLFTRNQRQDFTAFVRPSLLTNKDVSAIGAIFNYVSDISRLTADFPSLYFFPLGEYVLLLRHYNSGRQHAGRAIGVIEGIAVRQADSSELAYALAQLVERQADLLNVSATVPDIESQNAETSAEYDWNETSLRSDSALFIPEFLERREDDRLFLPFTVEGRAMLISALADTRITPPPFFAFGTNSDVVAQLERLAAVDLVSFFKTERPSFRNRRTNRVSSYLDGEEKESAHEPSMSLRPVGGETRLRPEGVQLRSDENDDPDAYEDTQIGSNAMSIRSASRSEAAKHRAVPKLSPEPDEDDDATVLTMRQIRDKVRAEEAAAKIQPEPVRSSNPIQWLIKLVSSFISPSKPE
ncbi:MAG: hypothetical protein ABI835_12495 [Chloroflexota bacterium]